METETIYVACMRCNRQRVDGVWIENAIPAGVKVSHGLCDECDEKYYSDKAIALEFWNARER
jgi:hypothetical protein